MRKLAVLAVLVVLDAPAMDARQFEDIASPKPFVEEVVVVSRMLDAERVRALCYWKQRESGVIQRGYLSDAPACSFIEQGRIVIVCTRADSFNEQRKLLGCGHELRHWHEGIDHR
jgi:hypothetical protein